MGESRTFKRKWFNGLAPEPFPAAILIGTADQVEGAAVLDQVCDWRFGAEDGASWSLNSQGPRIEFEDSLNCGGTNPLRQHGTAAATFVTSRSRILTLTLRGRTERQQEHYDVGQVFLDSAELIVLHGAPDGLGCVMGDVSATVTVEVAAGVHELLVAGDTVDGQYHVGAFFQLEWTTSPAFVGDAREWYAGYNALCYKLNPLALDALLTIPDIMATADQLIFAKIMVDLYDDVTVAIASLQALMGPTATVAGVPNDPSLIPGTVIGVRPDLTIVVIAGTSNVTQAATYSLFSGVGPVEFGPYKTNLVWRTAAAAVEARVTAAGADPTGRIILVGHSYGGAVAMLQAGDYLWHNPARKVDCLTFGACKPGDGRLADLVHRGRLVRISNEGDPVPGLPPAYSQILAYLTVLPASLILDWSALVQPTGQVILEEDGTVLNDDRSTLSLVYLIAVIAAVLGGPPLVLPFAHSSSAYVLRLENRLALPPGL